MLILLPEFHFIYFSKKTYVRKKIEVYEQIMVVKLWQRQIFSNILKWINEIQNPNGDTHIYKADSLHYY